MRKIASVVLSLALLGPAPVTLSPGQSVTITAAPAPDDTAPPASLMAASIFDQPVTSWAVDANSAAVVAEFVADYKASYGSVSVNPRPIYWVPAGQPMVPVSVQPGCNNDGVAQAPIPAGAVPGTGGDAILTVYQPSSGGVWEFWQAHPVTSTVPETLDGMGYTVTRYTGWSACWGGQADLDTFNGVFPWPYGETASGISNLATEVTQGDILAGAISHAIGLQVNACNRYVYPADRGDCGASADAPAEGQWFRFAPSVNCGAYDATVFENLVCKAGQTYGFVVVDHGGSDGIEADWTGAWFEQGNPGNGTTWVDFPNGWVRGLGGTDPISASMDTTAGDGATQEQGYSVIAGLPWSQLQVIDPPG